MYFTNNYLRQLRTLSIKTHIFLDNRPWASSRTSSRILYFFIHISFNIFSFSLKLLKLKLEQRQKHFLVIAI
ncbi:hypothetical protein I7I53_03348 [Histoplasma capsulatum var. duboisii H88]|uniref:Uncharacterized protein n=1 Tax=Ajellomyces capsulatus (strain H88) TaxID=544711 RepID=A0A8A1LNC5_AJEC8|nr:hypothetical protein I7I53_03348 [Histoplasma capsulatum var. duboisii H88]